MPLEADGLVHPSNKSHAMGMDILLIVFLSLVTVRRIAEHYSLFFMFTFSIDFICDSSDLNASANGLMTALTVMTVQLYRYTLLSASRNIQNPSQNVSSDKIFMT